MFRNVLTEMSPDRNGQTKMARDRKGPDRNGSDRNGQTDSARAKRPGRKVLFRFKTPLRPENS